MLYICCRKTTIIVFTGIIYFNLYMINKNLLYNNKLLLDIKQKLDDTNDLNNACKNLGDSIDS